MGLNYTQEKLWAAARFMATSPGTLQDRLRNAAVSLHLASVHVGFGEHPDLQVRFDALRQVLEQISSEPDDVATKVAEELFTLFYEATQLAEFPVGDPTRRTIKKNLKKKAAKSRSVQKRRSRKRAAKKPSGKGRVH